MGCYAGQTWERAGRALACSKDENFARAPPEPCRATTDWGGQSPPTGNYSGAGNVGHFHILR